MPVRSAGMWWVQNHLNPQSLTPTLLLPGSPLPSPLPSPCSVALAPAAIAAATGVPPSRMRGGMRCRRKASPSPSADAPKSSSSLALPPPLVPAFRPHYNAFPGCALPVVYRPRSSSSSATGAATATFADPVLRDMRWGLTPSFTEPDSKPDFFRMFNARSETVAEKGVFKRLVDTRRCVVVLDGFFEWTGDTGNKVPWYAHRADGRPLLLAGLYDTWRPGKGGVSYAGEAQEDGPSSATSSSPSRSSSSSAPSVLPFASRVDAAAPPAPGLAPSAGPVSDADAWPRAGADDGGGEDEGDGEGEDEEEEGVVFTVTLLTTASPPGSSLGWLHERQPVILNDHDAAAWLDVGAHPLADLTSPQATRSGLLSKPLFSPVDAGASTSSAAASSSSAAAAASPSAASSPTARIRLAWHPCDPRMNSLKYRGADASDPIDVKRLPHGAVVPPGSGFDAAFREASRARSITAYFSSSPGAAKAPAAEKAPGAAAATAAAAKAPLSGNKRAREEEGQEEAGRAHAGSGGAGAGAGAGDGRAAAPPAVIDLTGDDDDD